MIAFSLVTPSQTQTLRYGAYRTKKDIDAVLDALNSIKDSFIKAKDKSQHNEPRFIKDQMVEISQSAQLSLLRFLQELKQHILSVPDIIFDK